jgi:hypothetical protein
VFIKDYSGRFFDPAKASLIEGGGMHQKRKVQRDRTNNLRNRNPQFSRI